MMESILKQVWNSYWINDWIDFVSTILYVFYHYAEYSTKHPRQTLRTHTCKLTSFSGTWSHWSMSITSSKFCIFSPTWKQSTLKTVINSFFIYIKCRKSSESITLEDSEMVHNERVCYKTYPNIPNIRFYHWNKYIRNKLISTITKPWAEFLCLHKHLQLLSATVCTA